MKDDFERAFAALLRLARALPGVDNLQVMAVRGSPSFNISCSTEDAAHAIADAFDMTFETVGTAEHRWLTGQKLTPLGLLWVTGPHVKREPVVGVDSAELTDAIECAEVAAVPGRDDEVF